jgi:hypothetical protein
MNDEPKAPSRGNGVLDLKNLNWPTVILILVTGGGNWFATQNNGAQLQYQREQVFRQVHELHDSLKDFEDRQRQTLVGIEQSLKNQTLMIDGQNKVMASQSTILEHLKHFAQNYRNPER